MAPNSLARADITEKMVVPVLGNFDFREGCEDVNLGDKVWMSLSDVSELSTFENMETAWKMRREGAKHDGQNQVKDTSPLFSI